MTSRHELKILPGTPYPMGVSLTNDGKVNFAAALHTREECGVLLYLHAAGKPVRIPFTEKNRIGNIYCMQAEGLAGTSAGAVRRIQSSAEASAGIPMTGRTMRRL